MQADALCCVIVLKNYGIFQGTRISDRKGTSCLMVVNHERIDIWNKTDQNALAMFETLVLHSMASICHQ